MNDLGPVAAGYLLTSAGIVGYLVHLMRRIRRAERAPRRTPRRSE